MHDRQVFQETDLLSLSHKSLSVSVSLYLYFQTFQQIYIFFHSETMGPVDISWYCFSSSKNWNLFLQVFMVEINGMKLMQTRAILSYMSLNMNSVRIREPYRVHFLFLLQQNTGKI